MWTQDCPTVPSGRGDQSIPAPAILEEGLEQPPLLGIQSAIEKVDLTKQEHALDTVEEKPTSSLDTECGTRKESALDKEANSNEYRINGKVSSPGDDLTR